MPDNPRHAPRVRLIIWLIVGVLAIAALAGTVVYTERPRFCRVCHEMQPYYDAWASGKHADVSCIDCHVEPGVTARFLHKFVALKEVWNHFTTTPTFPSLSVSVPDSRCTPCHENVNVDIGNGLTHAGHAKELACQQCHASAGHTITFAALQSAGILRTGSQQAGAVVVGESLPAKGAHTALSGHKVVACSSCHDMATAQCSMCHKPPSNHFGADCKSCHKPSVPFKDAVFNHPSAGEHSYRSFPCEDCHPNGYTSATCVKCHKNGAPSGD